MSGRKAQTYAEAVASARESIAAARLADPGEHFPYKHDVVRGLLADNPPMGPDGPDDPRARAEDYTSTPIADASRAYVEAQAAYLRDPGDGTKAEYTAAAEDLVAARRAHRVSRPAEGMVVGIRSRRAGE